MCYRKYHIYNSLPTSHSLPPAGNNFRCDKRLSWMINLRNTTKSLTVQRNLDEVICYLEGTTMPPRLAEDETVTPAYETTTLGIGEYSQAPFTCLFSGVRSLLFVSPLAISSTFCSC